MKSLATMIVAALAVFSAVATPPPQGQKKPDKVPRKPVVSLSVGTARPNVETKKTGRRSVFSRSGTTKRTTKTVNTYSGRIYCKPPEGETATVTIEAFFVERKGSDRGVATDRILASKTIGTYTFGGGASHSQNFTFSSPEIKRVKTTRRSGGWRSARSRSSTTGTEYRGCFVRAICNGEIVSVKSVPSVLGWERAGKMPTPSLKDSNRL